MLQHARLRALREGWIPWLAQRLRRLQNVSTTGADLREPVRTDEKSESTWKLLIVRTLRPQVLRHQQLANPHLQGSNPCLTAILRS